MGNAAHLEADSIVSYSVFECKGSARSGVESLKMAFRKNVFWAWALNSTITDISVNGSEISHFASLLLINLEAVWWVDSILAQIICIYWFWEHSICIQVSKFEKRTRLGWLNVFLCSTWVYRITNGSRYYSLLSKKGVMQRCVHWNNVLR